jgi:hypothetical protein
MEKPITALMDNAETEPGVIDYWSDARTPLSSLLFLIPWIVVYEFGVLVMGQDQPDVVRNGADFWMRSVLSHLGFGNGLLLPVIVVSMLLTWHILRRNPWQVRFETQVGMLAESILLAIGLVAVGQCHDILFRQMASDGASWRLDAELRRTGDPRCLIHRRGRLRRSDVSPVACAGRIYGLPDV